MNKWRKNKFPKLQTIMIIAERHSRWGIGALSLILAILIHVFFLFGFKIPLPPIGNWETGNVLTRVALPKKTKTQNVLKKQYWDITINGSLLKYISSNEKTFSTINKNNNFCELKVASPVKEKQFSVEPVIIKITIPDGKKEISIVKSSGNLDFDSDAAAFINKLLITTNSLPVNTNDLSCLITVRFSHDQAIKLK